MGNAEDTRKHLPGERRIRSEFFLWKTLDGKTRFFGGTWEEKYVFVRRGPNDQDPNYFRWVPTQFVDSPKKKK